jgi:GTPase SAR1 family protein
MIILLLGDSGVGKTSIRTSFLSFASIAQKEISKYTPTQGMEIAEKPQKSESPATIQLWDVGGTSLESRNLLNAIISADVILLVYDITHLGSFHKLQTVLQKIRIIFGLNPELKHGLQSKRDIRMPYIALVANKIDLEAERVIPQSLHDNFFKKGQFNSSCMCSIQRGDQTRNWLTTVINDLMGIKVAPTKKVEKAVKRSNSLVKEIRADIRAARNFRDGTQSESNCSIM